MFSSFNTLLKRFKEDKKLLIIAVVAVTGVLLLMFSSVFGKTGETDTAVSGDAATTPDSTQYAQKLEDRLEALIGRIDGAGSTLVMVTLDTSVQTVYASENKYSSDKRTDSDTSEESSDGSDEFVVLDRDGGEEGAVVNTVEPRVRGVAVVCEGGGSPAVCAQITELLTSLLDIGANRVSVSKIQK